MMIKGLLGKKLGMTTVFDETGNQRQCTVIHVEPNIVTQVRTEERDGYAAIQLGMGFTLIGVGGLRGLNRTAKIEVLRAGK